MKKHPIDDLFSRKLHDVERRPRASSWSRIADSQDQKKKKAGVWIWYAAASVLLVFFAGYTAWQGLSTQKGDVALEHVVKSTAPAVDSGKTEISGEEKSPVKVKESPDPIALSSVSAKATRQVRKKIADNSERKVEFVNSTNERIAEATPDVNSIESSVPDISNISALAQEPEERVTSVREENRVIVVNVEMPDSFQDEKPKTSKFNKVFRQLKNARAGEPVDWREVGINPKNIFAKAEGKSRNRNEQYQEK